jgi:benzoate-CoA ligase family protein
MTTTAVGPERYNASLLIERNLEAGRADKPAFKAVDGTLTYDELRRQVNRAGHFLRELGVRREDRVLLVMDDTTAFPITFLGAMRIGAVPVPVSPLDRTDNYRHYAEDSYAAIAVSDANLLPRVREAMDGLGVRYVSRGVADEDVIDFDAGLAAQSDELEAFPTHRDDMAFWLYSSGSTGKPKGVVHLQHDIEITCECFAGQVLGIRSDDVIFSTTKLFHAYGLGNGLSFPLWFGATTVLMQGPARPERIIATLAEHRPTVFCSVPGLYGAIVRHPDADGALDSVRMCVSAAEALPPQTFDRWRERFGLEIVDGIGSTEMLHIFCSNRPGEVERGTTGFPVPGYELRLTDEAGAVLEGAAAGALEVRGDSCAAFYWHQHEKTKSSMRGDWFYTGDRFERRADGAYAFVGRNDEMLKVGGLWASPIDMENVLIGHPAVGAAGVVGITVDDQSRIAAFVERAGGEMSDEQLAEELRAMCKERLRRYEYPHVVQVVDALPRTPTGKIQRFKLRDLVSRGSDGSTG